MIILGIGKVPISEKDFTFGEKCENYKSIEDTHVLSLPCTLGFISEDTVYIKSPNDASTAKDKFEKLKEIISRYVFGQAFVIHLIFYSIALK